MKETIDRFVGEAIPAFVQSLKESDKRIDRVNEMMHDLSKSDKDKTKVFVHQIEKLSKRLDAAYAENARLIDMLAKCQAQYERLYNLLEHKLSSSIINNSNN